MSYNVILRNGLVYDGSGNKPFYADLGIQKDIIIKIGDLSREQGILDIDCSGLIVCPGFINMLSWGTESLLVDGRAVSDIHQGVTLEIFGEGHTMGPLNQKMKDEMKKMQSTFIYDIEWTTLGEYLQYLEKKGVSPNIASFVGASTLRTYVMGYVNRQATTQELNQMKILLEQAMKEGALGFSTALIYPPGNFATTTELIELARVAAKYNGLYTSHIRNESSKILEAIDEFLLIAKEAKIPAEIYHFKVEGKTNWKNLNKAIGNILEARKEGHRITTNMYTYSASATGITSLLPPEVHEGGMDACIERLKNPDLREKIKKEILLEDTHWDNIYPSSGPQNMILVEFRSQELKKYIGKTLLEISELEKKSPEDTILDLIVQDKNPIPTIFFTMCEENIKKNIQLPFMSFCSDEVTVAPYENKMAFQPHPRAYGNFARLLGKYVRTDNLITLEEAIFRLTSLPATNLGLKKRGKLNESYFADVIVFDINTIQDLATYEQPHQLAEGFIHVFVNGVMVLRNGTHTNAKPGRFLKGPGYIKNEV